MLALSCQQGRCVCPSRGARRPQSVAAVPRGLDLCWGWGGPLSGMGSFGPDCQELLLSSMSPAAPTLASWGKADLAMGFLLLVYQAANSSCSLSAVSKLNVSNLLSCSLASEETFSFSNFQ